MDVNAIAAAVAVVKKNQIAATTDAVSGWLDDHPEVVANVEAAASVLSNDIASTFSTSRSYGSGEYVMYQGGLYRFTKSHIAGSWNSAEVTEANIADEINKSNTVVGDIYPLAFAQGGYIDTVSVGSTASLTPVTNNSMTYCIAPCIADQIFYVRGVPYNNSHRRPIMFLDANNACLSVYTNNNELNDLKVVAPENAVKIVINLQKNNGESAYANGLPNINKRINDLAAIKADKSFTANCIPDISLEGFNFQQDTIHHDNFHRQITGEKLWHIGTNGTESYPMNYYSLASDYDTADDGFRIIDGQLTVDNNAAVANSFRVLENVPSSPFLAEVGFTADYSGVIKRCNFVYNIIDQNNYDSFEFVVNQTTDKASLSIYTYGAKNGVTYTETLLSGGTYTSNSVRILFAGGLAHIYLDDAFLASYVAEIVKNGKVGIRLQTKTIKYKWEFINVHNLIPVRTLDSGYANDYFDTVVENDSTGVEGNNVVIQRFFGDKQDYFYNPDTTVTLFSKRSEKFELRRISDNLSSSRRTEMQFAKIPYGKLRKIKLEFDIYFPESYTSDSLVDGLVQVLSSSNYEPEILYNPCFALRTLNDKIDVHIWGQSKNDDATHEDDEVFEIADVEREKWIHFEIYIKEGYMQGHCPLTVIKMDGKLVYRSTMINTVNTAIGADIKYGIYKSAWYAGQTGNVDDRIVYFDNVKMTI